jgi:hypothetical protein
MIRSQPLDQFPAKTLPPPPRFGPPIKPSTPSTFPLFQFFWSTVGLSTFSRRSPPSLQAGLTNSGNSGESESLLLLLFSSLSSGSSVDVHGLFQFAEDQASHSNPWLTCVGVALATPLPRYRTQPSSLTKPSSSPQGSARHRRLHLLREHRNHAGVHSWAVGLVAGDGRNPSRWGHLSLFSLTVGSEIHGSVLILKRRGIT